MKSLPLAIGLTCAIAVVIGHGTLSPPSDGPPLPLGDKQIHFIAFALLALPLGWVRPRWVLPLVAGCVAYGGAIELLQPLVGRSGEWADLLADALGVVLGVLPGQVRRPRRFG